MLGVDEAGAKCSGPRRSSCSRRRATICASTAAPSEWQWHSLLPRSRYAAVATDACQSHPGNSIRGGSCLPARPLEHEGLRGAIDVDDATDDRDNGGKSTSDDNGGEGDNGRRRRRATKAAAAKTTTTAQRPQRYSKT